MSTQEASEAFRTLYEAWRPTAIVLGAPRITIGALDAIGNLKLRVPDDLSVMGFGDQAWMNGWGPGLSTIRMPVRDLALACGSFLLRRIREKSRETALGRADFCQTMHRPSLILRGSTAPPCPTPAAVP